MKRFLAMLLTVLCLCSPAGAEESSGLGEWLEENVPASVANLFADETVITAIGTEAVEADIDMAVLSFELSGRGETVDAANAQVTASINALTQALVAHGVDEQLIWRKSYDVSADVVYHNTKMSQEKIIEGFIVEIVLNVRMEDLALIGKVIDAAMQIGAGGTHELVFEKSQLSQAYEGALAQAAQQAMQKAAGLAQSCGMQLGALVSVTELSTASDEYAKVEVTYRAQ